MSGRAVLVGLNHYPNPANNLRGCVNDVLQVSRLLQEAYGFEDGAAIRVLTDERATTRRIVERLEWLVDGARGGDTLVFHYSGHGAQVRDRNGDELDDGLDEIICPYDLDWDRPFTDDDFGRIVGRVPAEASLTVLLDCCHAGTGLRELTLPCRTKCLQPPPDILHRTRPRIEDCGPSRRLTMTAPRIELRLRRFGASAATGRAVLMAACRADQTSADAWIDGDYHGAFTYFFCRAAADLGYHVSHRSLVDRVRVLLREAGYGQLPQLEGEEEALALPVFGQACAV